MLVGKFVHGKSYPWVEYLEVSQSANFSCHVGRNNVREVHRIKVQVAALQAGLTFVFLVVGASCRGRLSLMSRPISPPAPCPPLHRGQSNHPSCEW